jgi:hypothetical protein
MTRSTERFVCLRVAVFLTMVFCECICRSSAGQSALWNGTWNLDVTHSQAGTAISLTQTQDGTYQLVSRITEFQFRCDGSPYPVFSRIGLKPIVLAVVCDSISSDGMELHFLKDGKLLSKRHLQVSPDETTMTDTMERPQADSTKSTVIRNLQRISGKSGLLGTWNDANDADIPDRLMKISVRPGTITVELPFAHQITTAPLTGAPARIMRNHAATPATLSIQAEGAMIFRVTMQQNGVIQTTTIMRLGPGGETIVEDTSAPGEPKANSRQVYRRGH